MKEYVCTVCGYVHKGELPEDFVCPVCGAGRDAFREVNPDGAKKVENPVTEISRNLRSSLVGRTSRRVFFLVKK